MTQDDSWLERYTTQHIRERTKLEQAQIEKQREESLIAYCRQQYAEYRAGGLDCETAMIHARAALHDYYYNNPAYVGSRIPPPGRLAYRIEYTCWFCGENNPGGHIGHVRCRRCNAPKDDPRIRQWWQFWK